MSWEGEVSAAIFVDEEPNSEAAGRMCEEIVRVCDEAAFQGHRSPWTITAVFRVDASEIRCAAYDCLYPINALRNVALRAASAEFVFLLDVDFVPSRGLQALDASTLRRLLSCGEDAFAALVIPAFEVRSQSCLPTSGLLCGRRTYKERRRPSMSVIFQQGIEPRISIGGLIALRSLETVPTSTPLNMRRASSRT